MGAGVTFLLGLRQDQDFPVPTRRRQRLSLVEEAVQSKAQTRKRVRCVCKLNNEISGGELAERRPD